MLWELGGSLVHRFFGGMKTPPLGAPGDWVITYPTTGMTGETKTPAGRLFGRSFGEGGGLRLGLAGAVAGGGSSEGDGDAGRQQAQTPRGRTMRPVKRC
jgi:hypothetical protein